MVIETNVPELSIETNVLELSIKVIWAQELPDELKETYAIGEYDSENYMIIKHDGKVTSIVSDYMEPEDATFTRGLSWIPELLQEVYELGKQKGGE